MPNASKILKAESRTADDATTRKLVSMFEDLCRFPTDSVLCRGMPPATVSRSSDLKKQRKSNPVRQKSVSLSKFELLPTEILGEIFKNVFVCGNKPCWEDFVSFALTCSTLKDVSYSMMCLPKYISYVNNFIEDEKSILSNALALRESINTQMYIDDPNRSAALHEEYYDLQSTAKRRLRGAARMLRRAGAEKARETIGGDATRPPSQSE